MKPDRIPILHQNPARLVSDKPWAQVGDREMVQFAMTHFDHHGDCKLTADDLSQEALRPVVEAMVYNGHARWRRSAYSASIIHLIGTMFDIVAGKRIKEELGLEMCSHTPWTSDFCRIKRPFA